MISFSINTITTMERIKQLHFNGEKWATQYMTLYLVQICGNSDFMIHFGSIKKQGQKQRAIEIYNRRRIRVMLKKDSTLMVANMKKKQLMT